MQRSSLSQQVGAAAGTTADGHPPSWPALAGNAAGVHCTSTGLCGRAGCPMLCSNLVTHIRYALQSTTPS